jgi:hypothetical protein
MGGCAASARTAAARGPRSGYAGEGSGCALAAVAALEGETAAAAAEYIECTAELDGHVTLLVLNKKGGFAF